MRRRLHIVLSVLSLALCAGLLGSWLPSYWVGGRWFHYRPGRMTDVHVSFGELSAQWIRTSNPLTPTMSGFAFTRPQLVQSFEPYYRPQHEVRFLGLHWFRWDYPPFTTQTGLVLPFWILAAASGTPLPYLMCLGQKRRIDRAAKGLCTACTYNLIGNTSGRCPECGTPLTVGVKV